MRRTAIVIATAVSGLVLVPAGSASAQDLPPLPCAYWVHSCSPA